MSWGLGYSIMWIMKWVYYTLITGNNKIEEGGSDKNEVDDAEELDHNEDEGWKVESLYVIDKPDSILQPIKAINGFSENEPIDACVNMIMKLNDENLL